MGALSPVHWLIIVGVLVVLFGAKRLPDAARSIGRSTRILKAEMREVGAGDAAAESRPTDRGGVAIAPSADVEPAAAPPAREEPRPAVPPQSPTSV